METEWAGGIIIGPTYAVTQEDGYRRAVVSTGVFVESLSNAAEEALGPAAANANICKWERCHLEAKEL